MPKKGISHDDIARRLGLARSTVTKILNQLPTNRASAETVQKVFQLAKELGYDFHRLRNIHRRRDERRQCRIAARLELLQSGGKVAGTGTAVVHDISLHGAQLQQVTMDGKGLPVTPFLLRLTLSEAPLADLVGTGEVVRFSSREPVKFGINFLEMTEADQRRLGEFLR
ncbi:MAG: PilZ domain-containing protein [Planctomycetales bacterium]|nr:PilZ domain-containing protein [Planctomycetales bacterium]